MKNNDKKVKILILEWLSKLFGYENYPHSFADQWINWDVWDGILSVSFDTRQKEQVKLISLIHPRFLGCPQSGTLKVVNEKTFYLELKRLIHIEYPDIKKVELIRKNNHQGGTGGWSDPSDDFYSYDWEVFLSDGTSIEYHNYSEEMDMVKGDFIYNSKIQKRAFINFLFTQPTQP